MEYNPYRVLVREFKDIVKPILGFEPEVTRAKSTFGYLSTPLHEVLRSRPSLASELEERLRSANGVYLRGFRLINGFLNADVNVEAYGRLVLDSAIGLGSSYGKDPGVKPMKIVVEHTSANPLHPLHIGHCRNMVLGDSLARLMRFMGHDVSVRFYLDDTGIQVMYLALGYRYVKDLVRRRIEDGAKPDHVMWIVYSVTNAVAEVQRITKQLQGRQDDEYRALVAERDEWVGVIGEWLNRDKEVVEALVGALSKIDVNAEAYRMAKAYEDGDPEVKSIVREAVGIVMRGFEETFKAFGVEFDSYDWESEITVYSGLAREVIKGLLEKAGHLVEYRDGVYVFRADKAAEEFNAWDELKLPRFIPPATLNRSDGTTLYLTRDIAYAIWCLNQCRPDRVIRVIAVEQTHPQAQLRLALKAMGYEAHKIIHYAYEMVNLSGAKMSSRRGQAVTVDWLLDEATRRVRSIASSRGLEVVGDVSRAVAVGAIRYYFASISPSKPITFDWGKALDMNQNSGPFIQYTYVRAHSILAKAGADVKPGSYSIPSDVAPEERELILLIGEFPSVLSQVSQDLRLENVAFHINRLALVFNSFYEKYPVINAGPGLREFRLALVKAVEVVLANAMSILGIPVVERM